MKRNKNVPKKIFNPMKKCDITIKNTTDCILDWEAYYLISGIKVEIKDIDKLIYYHGPKQPKK